MRRVVTAVLVAVLVMVTAAASAGAQPVPRHLMGPGVAVAAGVGADVGVGVAQVTYRLPTDAPMIDGFRPPATPYGPGNRGWSFATAPGSVVVAAGDGVVLFAGPVARTLHVTVLHEDGLRTSYSFLDRVSVSARQTVRVGDPLGVAGGPFHFGVRSPDGTYLDPASLFPEVAVVTGARLVPDDEVGDTLARRSAASDRTADRPAGPSSGPGPVGPSLGSPWPDPASNAPAGPDRASPPIGPDHSAAIAFDAWRTAGRDCTPAEVAVPAIGRRRLLVLVGGLGSTSDAAGIDGFPAASLGYHPGDVVRFSYNGGRVPDPTDHPDLGSIPTSSYGSIDTQGHLDDPATELARMLVELRRSHPGVAIDLVAHSQGGLVSRLAVNRVPDGNVATLVTLGTPHQGAPLADVLADVAPDPVRRRAIAYGMAQAGSDLDPTRPVFAELATTSELVGHLRANPPPASIRFASVAAAGDLVVPGPRTVVAGRPATVVPIRGTSAHDELPRSAEAARVVGLTVHGMPPPCTSAGAAAAAAIEGLAVERAERGGSW